MGYEIKSSVKVKNGKTFIQNKRLKDIVWGYDGDQASDYEEFDNSELAEAIYNKVTDTDRWSTHYEQVFKMGDKYYKTHYSQGSTEMQEELPYEHEGEWVKVIEVVPKEVTKTIYITKRN